jgi:hypothetical protein
VDRGQRANRSVEDVVTRNSIMYDLASKTASELVPGDPVSSRPGHAAGIRRGVIELDGVCGMLSRSGWLSGCDSGGPQPPTTEARRR